MNTLTAKVKVADPVAQERKRRLAQAGHCYNDLRKLANVSYSMADKWMNNKRTSKPCEIAYQHLTRRVR